MILIINGYGIFNIERYGLFIAYFKTLSDIQLKRHLQLRKMDSLENSIVQKEISFQARQ